MTIMNRPDPIKFENLLKIAAVLVPYTAYIAFLARR
jgi:hypothetical protein